MIMVLIVAMLVLAGCTREVVTEVVVTATPDPAAVSTPAEPTPTATEAPATPTPTPQPATPQDVEYVYQIGISADLTTTNYWAYLGPDGTIWNQYVLGGDKPSLYTYSAQRYDWVPSVAADFPTALQEEQVGGETLWTTEVKFKEGVQWSDGTEVTAEDFVFTAQTVADMQLSGNWPSIVDPEYFDHAEALDPHHLKIYFK